MQCNGDAEPLPFTVMAKPVGSICNLNCSYCYYSKEKQEIMSDTSNRMTEETLESFISQYIEACDSSVVSFVWHGGEPTLAGLDFYKLAVRLQNQYLRKGQICWNNLQTNGILLNDEWCSFLAEAKFDVGISIDGTQLNHDKHRKDRQGKGTYQNAKEAICRLQTHGIQPDLLCTVTSAAAKAPLDIYKSLRSLETKWMQFIPIVNRDPSNRKPVTPESVTGEEYGEFLCEVFDEWVLKDIGRTNIQLFTETARVWSGGSAGLCWMAPTCGRSLIIEKDGDIYSCDHFVKTEYRIGDIRQSALGTLANSAFQVRFGESKRESLPKTCFECEWLDVCNGGCPKDRFAITDNGEPGLNYLCSGLKRFFSYVKPAVSYVTKLSSNGLNNEEIMAKLRKQVAEIWKGIGRNDPCPCGSGKKAKLCCWHKRI